MTERHRLYLSAPGFEDADLVDGFLAGCRLEALADDWSPGNPEPITTTVRGWMRDGAMVSEDGFDLRTLGWRQRLTADDSATLAQGEAELARMLRTKGAALTWVTPDGTSATRWDIAYGGVPAVVWDDLGEMRQEVVLDCSALALPFGRSLEPVTVTASTADTPVGATITDCTATSGWASFEGTPTVDGGTAVKVQNNAADGLSLIFSAGIVTDIPMPNGRLLVVEWAVTGGTVIGPPGVWVGYPNGYKDLQAVGHEAIDATWYRSTYVVPNYFSSAASTGGPIWFWFFAPGPMSGGTRHFRVRDVSYTATLPHPRSRSLVASVAGSARTSGALTVQGTTGLGTVLLGIAADAAPVLSLSPYRSSGGAVTTDTACVSGGYSAINGTPLYRIPAALVPLGTYTVLVRLSHASTGSYAVYLQDGLVSTDTSRSVSITSGVWSVHGFDAVGLPRRGFENPDSAEVWLSLDGDAGVQVDEAWLVHADAALLWVEVGEEPLAGTRLTVAQPSASAPSGGVYVDGLAVIPKGGSAAAMSFEPGAVRILLVTGDCEDPDLTLTYAPAWLGHAAR